jgi:hypothetical protein
MVLRGIKRYEKIEMSKKEFSSGSLSLLFLNRSKKKSIFEMREFFF